MLSKRNIFRILVLFIFPASLWAAPIPQVTVFGKLLQVNKDFVLIQTETSKVKVPRKYLQDVEGYIVGKATVTVEAPFSEIIKINK